MVDINCDSLVKDIHLAIPEFATDLWIFAIGRDTTVELTDILVAFPNHPAGEFLTADTTGTVDHHALVHELFLVVTDPLWQLTEVADVWADSTTEVTQVVLVVVTGIQNHCVFVQEGFLELFW